MSTLPDSASAPDDPEINVLGEALQPCSMRPLTGYARSGSCQTGPQDLGSHTVCAQVTTEFLEYSRARGNDLTTAVPEYEPPRVLRRLFFLRNWSHHEQETSPQIPG